MTIQTDVQASDARWAGLTSKMRTKTDEEVVQAAYRALLSLGVASTEEGQVIRVVLTHLLNRIEELL